MRDLEFGGRLGVWWETWSLMGDLELGGRETRSLVGDLEAGLRIFLGNFRARRQEWRVEKAVAVPISQGANAPLMNDVKKNMKMLAG